MASYTLLKNQPLTLVLPDDFRNQGWEVSQNIAYHSGCNPGEISLKIDLSSSDQWTFKYEIKSITSGEVKIIVGGISGTTHNTAGVKEDSFVIDNPNVTVKFYATGTCELRFIQIYPEAGEITGTTFAFNEDADRWITKLDYHPEFMNKFLTEFFAFSNGRLWKQNVNPIRNNFFGVQYTSRITYYVNIDHEIVKNFSDMKINSNKPWSVPLIRIFPTEGKELGMVSRLKLGNFKMKQGEWFADFLRNMIDPRPKFTSQLDALFNGAPLQGLVMEITIENADTEEVRLISVDVRVSKQNYTY